MKTPLFRCSFVILALGACALAQGNPERGKPSRGSPVSVSPMPFPPRMNALGSASAIFVSGKVVLDDGAELTEPATIQTICKGQRHTETYSDAHGGFSFSFGDLNEGEAAAISDASSPDLGSPVGTQARRDPRDCELQAVLVGFSSQTVELARHVNVNGIDVGRVPLRRLAHVEGTSISVSSALAPGAARKALERAREQEKKGKGSEAEKSLEKAVEIYPKYAVAWYELGRAQLRNQDGQSAKHSFEQALAADPKYVNPYDGLAQLAALARDWHGVIDVTGKLFALNPVSFPDAYYYNSVGNYYLRNFAAAENSALQGIRVDEAHQIPKLQYLLSMILLQKQDYQAASEHMQLYLRLANQPVEVELAKKALAEIARLSASVGPSVVSQKK